MERVIVTHEIEAQPLAWRLLLALGAAQVLLHVVTNGNHGALRDEYYYLACADRLAWGYVDHPPLSIWLLAGWKAIFGPSVHAIRILPALCGAALVMLTGAVTAQLGGGRWAQFFAGGGTAIGAAGLVICGFYSMNCYDFLVWTGAYFLLIRIAATEDGRWWPWLGLVLGVGLLNKIGVLVFGVALVTGIALTPLRGQLRALRPYLAGALALVFLLPYALWNAANDWPTPEFIANAKQHKMAAFSPLGFLAENVLEANPVTVPLWIGGLLWLLIAQRARRYRIVALMGVVTWLVLVLQRGKPYYFAPSVPVLMAAGGAAWERWTSGRRWRWPRWVMAANLFAGLVIFLPLALPVLPPAKLVAYQQRLGVTPAPVEVGHEAPLPQIFADRLGWENLARTVAEIYRELPAAERSRAIALGSNYGHSSALEYWAATYQLPPVYGRHNNYWLWGPPPADDSTVVIAIDFEIEDLKSVFDEVVEAGVAQSRWASEPRISVFVCRGLKPPVAELWPQIKLFI